MTEITPQAKRFVLVILEKEYKKRISAYKKAIELSYLSNTAVQLREEIEYIIENINNLNGENAQPLSIDDLMG